MNRFILTLTAAAMAAGFATQGLAEKSEGDHGDFHHELFKNIDSNGDGSISADEMNAAYDAKFDKVDLDNNGAISRDELLTANIVRAQRRTDRMMHKYDANGDGVIAKSEMETGKPEKMFKMIDTDGNGAISPDEFKAAREKSNKSKN